MRRCLMNPRIQLFLSTVLFLGLTTLGIGMYNASAHRDAESRFAGQDQERFLVDKSRSDAPLKITLVKTKKRIVQNNQRIFDDDEWLQGLTLRIANHSKKSVTYVG